MRLAILPCCLPLALAAQGPVSRPADMVLTGRFQDPLLTESSGAAASRRFPGVLYTINDSGNDPVVFATDSSGRPRGRWRIPGTANRDWEAMALGPCPAGTCIYIGDTGDNLEVRHTVTIYRVPEPAQFEVFRGVTPDPPPVVDSLVFRYPDGAHDAEALWADETFVWIVSKGRSGAIRLYRLPGTGWDRSVVTATLVQELPIVPDQRLGRWVTDAALSPDGRTVAVRTYTEIYLFPVLPLGRLGTPRVCSVAGLERQGEGIAWYDQTRLVLTSEAPTPDAGTIYLGRCGA